MASPIENTDAASEIGAGCLANATDCTIYQIMSNIITHFQLAGVKQHVHWFFGGKGLGIQQGTSSV
jgi:hypothetical protein